MTVTATDIYNNKAKTNGAVLAIMNPAGLLQTANLITFT